MKQLKLTASYRICMEQMDKLESKSIILNKSNALECKHYSVTSSTGNKTRVIDINNVEKALYFASVSRSKMKVLDEIYHSIFHAIDDDVDDETQDNSVADLEPVNAMLEEEKNTYYALRKRIECLLQIEKMQEKINLLDNFRHTNFDIKEEKKRIRVEDLKEQIETTQF